MSRLHNPPNRNGGSAPVTNRFSENDIARANREHDLKYGLNLQFPTLYTNPKRLPETHTGPVAELWKEKI